MNGVRRFLGAAASTSTPPQSATTDAPPSALPFSSKPLNGPSWPPPSPSTATPPTPILTIKPDSGLQRFQPTPPPEDDYRRNPVYADSPSPSSPVPPAKGLTLRKLVTQSSNLSDKRSSGASSMSGATTTRDELLLSLLASQAVVDSRAFEILSSEQIDELTKEHEVLSTRVEAMSRKLTLETKMRDAAASLGKASKKPSKQAEEQIASANSRVDSAQQELWRLTERTHEAHRRLLEHRAGVLSYSVRSLEKAATQGPSNGAGEDSGYDSSNRSTLMSPATSSMTGVSTSTKARFDGRHLFAGHANTVVPRRQLSSEAAAAEITALEEKLKAATGSLAAASRKQAELTRDLTMMKLEKEEVELMMSMDLQSAEETITALQEETSKLEELDIAVQGLREEKRIWLEEKTQLQEAAVKVQEMGETRSAGSEQEFADFRGRLQEKDGEIMRIKAQWQAERDVWERRKNELEDEKMEDLARLQQEMDRVRDEDERALQEAHGQLDTGLDALRSLVKQHGIVLFSRDPSLQGLLSSVGTHLETLHGKMDSHLRAEGEWDALRRKLEEDVRAGLDKREALARDLEQARRERDEARQEARTVSERAAFEQASIKDASNLRSPVSPSGDSVGRITQILVPLWAVLPSPEARAAKFNRSGQYRTGSPTVAQSPGLTKTVTSLSELDVRSLKSLYDSTRQPMSPAVGSGEFSIEAFAARVQALIQDDRALIERLLRFAQAHDLLKKNAERAQKLAQEGNTALETYQKQVRTLEERNMTMASKQAALMEETQELQTTLERIENEKRQLEMLAAEQAETCAQLTEANNTLSARTLTLAEEAAAAPEIVRKQLEGQLVETRAELELARDEVDAMRSSEQSQRIALLDELNSMQTENGLLRAQLRARK
ncbi:hypothetical protein H0H87_009343 [Tephrocybe sp. NHM501043]|nr:hypothetical protein H0H87_001302 [Tephrocybe sp. NHM501043]KAG6845435.1 hypothetical protein H0H87_009343 [Tephrocybe sp. NHM501043]